MKNIFICICSFFLFFSLYTCKSKNDLKDDMKNMINLNGKDSVVLKLNQLCYYSFELYESVGITAEYIIDNQLIIDCIERKSEFHSPEKMKKGMTGADSATGIFIFKALKMGKTILTIRHLFRGDTDNEVNILVTVIK